jgi:glycerol-3-phosphate dehydrogenase
MSLPGATTASPETFGSDFKQRSGLSEASRDHLLRVYGGRASLVMEFVASDASLGEVFDEETGAIAAEVVLAFKRELAQTLSDCLLRRTMVGLNSTCGLAAVEAASRIAQEYLAWSADRTAAEIKQYQKEVAGRLSEVGTTTR